MITESYNVLVTALSALVHSEGIFGNIASFRRQKIALADGSVVSLPIISGNSMRNGLRRAVMWHAINLLGGADKVQLPKTAVNFLFSGGTLDSSSPSVDIAGYRRLREIFPPLGLFGGGVGNALIEGCLRVGHLYPICEETAILSSLVPPDVIPEGFTPSPVAQYTDSFQGTRRELFSSPKYKALLPPEERQDSEKRFLEGKKARAEGKHPEKRDSQQMIYEAECLAPGTRFFWRVGIQQATEQERACFLSALALYSREPTVGGKSGTGFGRIKIEAKGLHQLSPTIERSDLPAFSVGQQYEQHIRDNEGEILEWLRGMS